MSLLLQYELMTYDMMPFAMLRLKALVKIKRIGCAVKGDYWFTKGYSRDLDSAPRPLLEIIFSLSMTRYFSWKIRRMYDTFYRGGFYTESLNL